MRDPLEHAAINPRRTMTWSLLVLATLVVLALARPSWFGTLVVLGAFFLMIMLHELGHFVTAKRAGMKVTEFFVGFGPRVWSFQRGETEYGVKALPLGGYCKIIGLTNLDDVPPEDESRTYRAKTYPKKMMVILAGSTMHFLIAITLMFVLLIGAGDLSRRAPSNTIDMVTAGSPAAVAGLEPGDELVAIDGNAVDFPGFVQYVQQRDIGDEVTIAYTRNGESRTATITLAQHPDLARGTAFVGVAAGTAVPEVGVAEALWLAPARTFQLGVDSTKALGSMFSPAGISKYLDNFRNDPTDEPGAAPSADDPADHRFVSPIGFGRLANQAVNAGWVEVVGLLLSINLFVGIFNLVPLIPFDGGHAAVATYEAIASKVRRRKVTVDFARLMPVAIAVMSVMMIIGLSSIFLEVTDPVPNPFGP